MIYSFAKLFSAIHLKRANSPNILPAKLSRYTVLYVARLYGVLLELDTLSLIYYEILILRIEENISISHQTLTHAGKGMVTVHFLPESQYLGGTGKFIYKPTNLQY